MKTALFLFFLALSNLSYSQLMLGQTKKYIINHFSSCYIEDNNDSTILFKCDNHIYMFYFRGEYNLCKEYRVEAPRDDKENYIKYFKEQELYTYEHRVITKTIGEHKATFEADLFTNEDTSIILMNGSASIESPDNRMIIIYEEL